MGKLCHILVTLLPLRHFVFCDYKDVSALKDQQALTLADMSQ